jgi:L-seryl-tRNA(Ser) seleniumtransferase
VAAAKATVGGGGAPGVELESAAVSLPESLAVPLRRGEPAVVGRLESGRLLLDLRSVSEDHDERLTEAVLAAAGTGSS